MIKTVISNSIEDTRKLGEKLGTLCQEKTVLTLDGDLGAGKTTMTQGIAKGLNIKKTVSSPTFTILKIYQGRLPLYHFDAYRLEGSHEDLGFEEMIDGDGVAVIEWPQFMMEDIPEDRLSISIKRLDEDQREITFTSSGAIYDQLLEDLL